MASTYIRLLQQHKFQFHTVFLARLDKQVDFGQVLDEIEL